MSEEIEAKTSVSSLLNLMIFLSVVYIVYACLAALVLKYIFLDYFARIGWATNFSYVTVVMMLLTTKFVVSFSTASVKNALKRQKS
jgi:hypothetical protein